MPSAAHSFFSSYLTLTTRVAVEFELSIPSNLTVPLGMNWKLAGGGGAVTPRVIIMLCALIAFPRLAIVQTITLPPRPGDGALQEAGLAAVAGVNVTELIASRGSTVIVNTTLVAVVFVPFDTVQVRMPVSPGWIVLGIALPDTGTEMVGSVCGGGGTVGWLVRKALLKVSDDPFVSKAVTVEVRVMAAAFICATTVMFSACPGAMDGTLQMV